MSRAWQVLREEGLTAVGARVATRAQDAILRDTAAVWFGRALAGLDVLERRQVPGRFSVIEPEKLADWLRTRDDLAYAADVRELDIAARCAHQWACWTVAGEIVAFCKIGGRQAFIIDFDRAVLLPDGLAFLSEIHVLPQARRKSIGRELLVGAMDFLAGEGFTVMSCHIPEVNRASTRLFTSVGFEPFGRIRFTRIVGIARFSTPPTAILEKIAEGCHGLRSR